MTDPRVVLAIPLFALILMGIAWIIIELRRPKIEVVNPQPPQNNERLTLRDGWQIILTFGLIAAAIWLFGGWPWLMAHWQSIGWSVAVTVTLTAGLQIGIFLLTGCWAILKTAIYGKRCCDWRGRPYQEIFPPLVRQRSRPQGWID